MDEHSVGLLGKMGDTSSAADAHGMINHSLPYNVTENAAKEALLDTGANVELVTDGKLW